MIDLLLLRGANPDVSACPLPAIMYAILASDVAGVMRVARKSSAHKKVNLLLYAIIILYVIITKR